MMLGIRKGFIATIAVLAMSCFFVFPTVFAAKSDMDAVSLAKSYIGNKYSQGGQSPSTGFDSSGLVYYIYHQLLGYDVPRDLKQQSMMKGTTIDKIKSLKYGDILFFGNGHAEFTGIYIGNNKFIMANYTFGKVMERQLTGFYKNQFLYAKRVLTDADHKRAKVMVEARKHLGTPYEFGAKVGQTKTFDCSSLVKHVYEQIGVTMTRVSKNQAKQGTYVSKSNLKVGDLVFFTTPRTGKEIGHVGIYAGNGQMIHTYGEGGVKFTPLDKPYWKNRYVTARRVIH